MPTRAEVLEGLGGLAEVYPLRADATLLRLADVWMRVLGELEPGPFFAAVRQYERGDHRWFPTPGKIRALAVHHAPDTAQRRPDTPAGRYKTWEQDGGLGHGKPCPICDSVLAVDPATQRLTVRHDAQRHREAGVGYSGP